MSFSQLHLCCSAHLSPVVVDDPVLVSACPLSPVIDRGLLAWVLVAPAKTTMCHQSAAAVFGAHRLTHQPFPNHPRSHPSPPLKNARQPSLTLSNPLPPSPPHLLVCPILLPSPTLPHHRRTSPTPQESTTTHKPLPTLHSPQQPSPALYAVLHPTLFHSALHKLFVEKVPFLGAFAALYVCFIYLYSGFCGAVFFVLIDFRCFSQDRPIGAFRSAVT